MQGESCVPREEAWRAEELLRVAVHAPVFTECLLAFVAQNILFVDGILAAMVAEEFVEELLPVREPISDFRLKNAIS